MTDWTAWPHSQKLTDYLYSVVGGNPTYDDRVRTALAAESALQARACRVPADSDTTPEAIAAREALREALFRRVAVNLARRGLPLGMQMSDVGAARISSNDPEVRRMESPYRKLPVG